MLRHLIHTIAIAVILNVLRTFVDWRNVGFEIAKMAIFVHIIWRYVMINIKQTSINKTSYWLT